MPRIAFIGAGYVVASFQIGGLDPATRLDFELPKRYGVRQTITADELPLDEIAALVDELLDAHGEAAAPATGAAAYGMPL